MTEFSKLRLHIETKMCLIFIINMIIFINKYKTNSNIGKKVDQIGSSKMSIDQSSATYFYKDSDGNLIFFNHFSIPLLKY